MFIHTYIYIYHTLCFQAHCLRNAFSLTTELHLSLNLFARNCFRNENCAVIIAIAIAIRNNIMPVEVACVPRVGG